MNYLLGSIGMQHIGSILNLISHVSWVKTVNIAFPWCFLVIDVKTTWFGVEKREDVSNKE